MKRHSPAPSRPRPLLRRRLRTPFPAMKLRERLEAVRPAAAEVDQALLARLPKDKRARFLKDLGRLIAGPPETAAVDPAAKSGGKKKKKSKKSGA